MKAVALIAFAAVVCGAVALPNPAAATAHRSRAVAREFQREHPCRSTGRTIGACPDYWRDHIVPLAVADGRRREGQRPMGAEGGPLTG